jgi:trehalose/maltose transport system substrate-binding protein
MSQDGDRREAFRPPAREEVLRLMTRRVVTYAMPLLCGLFLMALADCHSAPSAEHAQPVTITYLGWGPVTTGRFSRDESAFSRFTEKTGIRVHYIPGPETSTETLETYEQSLASKQVTPDVYLLDVVWPGILAEHLADLRPYLGAEAKDHLDAAVQNDTVDGRLVAMPFFVETGVLYYRTDLLKKYGYKHPPETWDELEKMSVRIQAAERSAGRPNFWGFVWQGAANEGLTCDALEWEESQGGGRLIEDDGTIDVNNSQNILALKRARRWVGTISPPSVTEFKEEDSRNVFITGNAAFRRDWIWSSYTTSQGPESAVRGKFAITRLPGGGAGHASAMGGRALAVSKYSAHPREAAELVRYLTSREVGLGFWNDSSLLPARKDFYQERQYLESQPDLEALRDLFAGGGAINRPSAITGKRYADVSQAYFNAVHSVLTGEVTAEKAMADLELQLVKITGLHPGQPKPVQTGPGSADLSRHSLFNVKMCNDG